jgi:tetratricopeptide (TPR) repeat protein
MAAADAGPTGPVHAPSGPLEPVFPQLAGYRVLSVIGSGGMGVVYRAEQPPPLARTVAVKVLRIGLDTPHLAARFDAERQALAVLDHPGIAKVLDAGATADGRPFFVMELVEGVPIDAFCDEKRLDARQRLSLFAEVCRAVHHAHQKGVIHRDLKPSNVLVDAVEGRPRARVIDFGVAKVARAAGDATALTQHGVVLGTPAYMSPEQAAGSDDIDTTTDVYSLGVLLYHLLVGRLPFEPGPHAKDPLRPSTRVGTLGAEATTIAERRGTDARTLRRQLAGDLDWITLKAMEHGRARRYASASELAADVDRYLAKEPILARPPSAAYRVRKLVARHRALVAAGALAVLALVAGTTAATIGFVRARRAEAEAVRQRRAAEAETAKAAAVTDFLKDVLAAADPRRAGRDAKVVDVLSASASAVDRAYASQPEIEGAVRDTLAGTWRSLGELPRAEEQARRAVEVRAKALGPDHRDTLASQGTLMAVLQAQGRYPEAQEIGRRTLDAQRRVLGPDHADVTTTLNDLGIVLFQSGQGREAEALMREAVETRRRTMGPDDRRTLGATSNLAGLLSGLDRPAEAEPLLAAVLDSQQRTLGAEHANTNFTRKTLAGVLHDLGRLDDAERHFRDALAASRRISGPDHIDTLITENDLAVLLLDRRRAEEAAALAGHAAAGAAKVLPPGHWFTAAFRRNHGRALTAVGRYAEAEAELQAALEALRASRGETHRETLSTARRLAELYDAWKRPDRAAAVRARYPDPRP